MICVLSFGGTSQKQALKDQKGLYHHQQLRDLRLQDSLSFPPREDKETPIKANITEIITETTVKERENSSLTNGCTIAKIIIATAKFKKAFPSSLRPLNQFIEKF